MTTTTNGAPSKPITAPKPPKPPTVPWPKPRSIHDARRSRLDRELDAAIERVRPAVDRFNRFALANGIDPRELLSIRAAAIWSGRAVSFTATPRAWIF